MNQSSKSKLWWFAGLFLRLLFVSFSGLILGFSIAVTFGGLRFSSPAVFLTLMTIGMIIGHTWAIYFRFPFFQSRTSRQRLFISVVIAVPTVFLTYCCVTALLTAALIFATRSDRRTESVTLPSGEVLENHTHYESGWDGGDRYNKLFLKNPAKRTSELVGDLNYEAESNTPSLFAQSPHPQEFTCGDKKVLVIGSYLCERINSPNAPYWDITTINADTDKLALLLDDDARAYLKSFLPTNDIPSHPSPFEIGLEGRVRFVFDSLDLTNNILTIKKQMPKAGENWDEFPPYLVYSALGFNDDSIYTFPSKFDIARTKAKNGLLWDNTMPRDISSITVQSAGFGARRKIAEVTARVIELLHAIRRRNTRHSKRRGCFH